MSVLELRGRSPDLASCMQEEISLQQVETSAKIAKLRRLLEFYKRQLPFLRAQARRLKDLAEAYMVSERDAYSARKDAEACESAITAIPTMIREMEEHGGVVPVR